MATPILDMEGVWEEILAQTAALSGRRVHVTITPVEAAEPAEPLSEKNQRMLATLHKWQTLLTDEDKAFLDEMLEYNLAHRFSLRKESDQ